MYNTDLSVVYGYSLLNQPKPISSTYFVFNPSIMITIILVSNTHKFY